MLILNLVKQGNRITAKFKAMTKAPEKIELDEHEYHLIDEVQCVGETKATYIRNLIKIDKRSFRKGKSYNTKNNNYINPNF
jgi:hypothetical protein